MLHWTLLNSILFDLILFLKQQKLTLYFWPFKYENVYVDEEKYKTFYWTRWE